MAQQVLNRVFRQLISNDFDNLKLFNREISGMSIHEYGDSESGYGLGDVVWLKGDGQEQDSYLLRSIRKDNDQDPRQALSLPYVDGSPDFNRFGWKNLNYTPSLSAAGVYSAISDCVDAAFTSHETDLGLHKYEKISPDPESEDYVFGKIAKKDFSNVKEDRNSIFFPFQTGHFTTDSVLNGIYRIWDNGYLEMDIVFRLGKEGVDDLNPVISANNVSFSHSSTVNVRSRTYNANTDYFLDDESLGVFDVGGYPGMVKVGNIPQANRNDFVNAYFAEIDFSKADMRDRNGNKVYGFVDLNYMIFKSDTLCQTRNLRDGRLNPA